MARGVALVAALTVVLAGAATAQAADRHASPTGSGPACTEATPCDLITAVEGPGVADGDQVIVAPGTYDLGFNQLDVANAIEVRGRRGEQFPVIQTQAGNGVFLQAAGAALRDVMISHSGSGTGLLMSHGLAERVLVSSDGTNACGVFGSIIVIGDAVCSGGTVAAVRVEATGGANVTAPLVNVTAAADSSANTGLIAMAAGGSVATLDARNVIAQAGTSGDDVYAQQDGGSTTTVMMANSNYATEGEAGGATVPDPGSGSNQIAQPRFLPFITYPQAPGSPTIDAGASGPLMGSFDLTGGPRVEGPAPDIGADEADGSVPETTIDSGPSGTTDDDTPTFAFSASEPASFACRVDGGAYGSCSGPGETHTTEPLSEGEHTFEVVASDFYNVDPTPATRTFTVDAVSDPPPDGGPADTDPPETTIRRTRVRGDDVRVRFGSDEPGSTFRCKLDRRPYRACTSPRRARNLDDGRHRFRVIATDAAGNSDPSAARSRVEID